MDEQVLFNMPVSFLDVSRHAPPGASLAKLGELLGLPKLSIPDGYSIERMDVLLAERRQDFLDYAIRDAEIAVKYEIEVLKFARQNVWAKDEKEDQDESHE